MAMRIDDLRRFYEKAGMVFIFNGIILSCGFFKNIILARYVTGADLGLYSLLLAITSFLHPLSLVGQQTALVRFLSSHDPNQYDFARGVKRILLLSTLIIMIGVFVASKIYVLGILPIVFLLIVTVSSAVNQLLSAAVRPLGQYFLSVLNFSGVNLFHLLGFIALAISGAFSSTTVLWLYILVSSGFTVATVFVSTTHFKKGNKPFPPSIWRDGILMFGTDLSLIVITTMDRFFIPKLISLDALGLYFAISAVMRLFDLTVQSIEFVFLTYVARVNKRQLIWITCATFGGGLLLACLYLLGAPTILSFVFNGQYDHGAYLIPLFCIVGVLRFVYVIPYTVINGRLHARRLKQLLYMNTSGMLLSISLSFLFILWWGLAGAVIANIAVWSFRAVSAIAIVYREYRSPTSSNRGSFSTLALDQHA